MSRSPFGLPLCVESTGRGNPPLVLVHGFGASRFSWRKWVPDLSRGHRVHAVDLMGAGRAPAPPGGDYSPGAQAGRLIKLLRVLEGGPPVLVGHSLGGAIVLMAALRNLDEGGRIPLRGLVVVSGAVYPQKLPRYMALARRPLLGRLFLAAPPPRWALRRGIRGIVADPASVDGEQVEGYRQPLRRAATRRALLRAARQVDPADAGCIASRYPQIPHPTLILWGEADPVVPASTPRRLTAALPAGRAVSLPGVGHLPAEEAPEVSLRAVRDFLAALP